MFSKLIPNSVAASNGPRGRRGSVDAKKAATAALPPTFRNADGEQDFRPGGIVDASDRSYRVASDGSLRTGADRSKARKQGGRERNTIASGKQRNAARIEVRLRLQDAARARKRAARALAKAKRTQARVEHLRQKLDEFRWVK